MSIDQLPYIPPEGWHEVDGQVVVPDTEPTVSWGVLKANERDIHEEHAEIGASPVATVDASRDNSVPHEASVVAHSSVQRVTTKAETVPRAESAVLKTLRHPDYTADRNGF